MFLVLCFVTGLCVSVSCLFLFDIISLGAEFVLYETPVFLSFSSQLSCWFLGSLAFVVGGFWSFCQRSVPVYRLLVVFWLSVVTTCGMLLDNQEGLTEFSEYLTTSPQMFSLCLEWVGYMGAYYLFVSFFGRVDAVIVWRSRYLMGLLSGFLVLGWFFFLFLLLLFFVFKGTQLGSCVRGCFNVFLDG